MFRSGKEKNLFIFSVTLIFILFFLAMFLINKSYALPTAELEEEKIAINQESSVVKGESLNQIILVESSDHVDKNDPDLRNFGVVIQDGHIFPQAISLNSNDKVCLSLTALDDNYHFLLQDFAIEEYLNHGETKEIIFQADKTGSYNYSTYQNNQHLSSGEIIINN
jgi:heme/copper-type cytochrome/quinol oxidase subunit 2